MLKKSYQKNLYIYIYITRSISEPVVVCEIYPGAVKKMVEGDEDLPRDAKIVKSILKSMGVEDYETRVIHQFLELWYRYVVDVLTDAQVYLKHAGKGAIDSDDVKLWYHICNFFYYLMDI